MEPSDLLRHVCLTAERLGIRYLVTGSQATIVFGEPRFTNDIDVVVDLTAANVTEFAEEFPADEYYLSLDAAREAIANHSMFNIIHPASGIKIDVIIPGPTAHERSRFERGQRICLSPDFVATFASPEDVILKKLEFYKLGGSDKHLRDIAGVLKISGDKVDRAYIERLASQFGTADAWLLALERVRPQ